MFVNSVKYCEIREILSRQYFSDFTIFHGVSHVSQYCTVTLYQHQLADDHHVRATESVIIPAGLLH